MEHGLDKGDYTEDMEVIDAFISTESKIELTRERLYRHMMIRHILTSRTSFDDGITTLAEMGDLLGGVSSSIVSKDFKDLGVMQARLENKYKDKWGKWRKKYRTIYVIGEVGQRTTPSISQEIVANKVASLLYMHVLRPNRFENEVILVTEQGTSDLVASWIDRLTWDGVIYVLSSLGKVVIIKCRDEEYAKVVLARVTTREVYGQID